METDATVERGEGNAGTGSLPKGSAVYEPPSPALRDAVSSVEAAAVIWGGEEAAAKACSASVK